jgi:tRNA (cmo5U34)-methyltransferase
MADTHNNNVFDQKAREWDSNPVHVERSRAIALKLLEMVPLTTSMHALEYGSGTGLLSFNLHKKLATVIMMDSSSEMTKVAYEKIVDGNIHNMQAIQFDLEHHDYTKNRFDIIYNQMVMHHVNDLNTLFHKFYHLLNPAGYLAIADLYEEDGSFHGHDFTGHKGFNIESLKILIANAGFKSVNHETCYTLNKVIVDGSTKSFPVFLLVARK